MEADEVLWALGGVLLTVVFYMIALVVHGRWKWLHPLVVTCGLLMGLIALLHVWVPLDVLLEKYEAGGAVLKFVLGPATVALAVPLYRRLGEIRAQMPAVLGSVMAGGVMGVMAGWAVVRALGGDRGIQLAMMSRSVTTPISMAIAGELHAPVELAACFTAVSGLLGAVLGPAFLRQIGVRSDLPMGLGIGTAAHGLGTSSLIRVSEPQGAAAGLAMALNGIFTSVLMVPVYYCVQQGWL